MTEAKECEAQKLKVLMLHGWSQNGKLFSDRTGPIRRKLGKICDLQYITAPHDLPMIEGGRENAKAWFYYDATDILLTSRAFDYTTPRTYVKWPESRQIIAEHFQEHGPFDALLGFSQGAVVTHQLLVEMQAASTHSLEEVVGTAYCTEAIRFMFAHPLRFAILVAGFPSNHSLQSIPASSLTKLTTPSLHITSPLDTTVEPHLHEKLVEQFAAERATVVSHSKGHQMPHNAETLNQVLDWVNSFAHKHSIDS